MPSRRSSSNRSEPSRKGPKTRLSNSSSRGKNLQASGRSSKKASPSRAKSKS